MYLHMFPIYKWKLYIFDHFIAPMGTVGTCTLYPLLDFGSMHSLGSFNYENELASKAFTRGGGGGGGGHGTMEHYRH